MKRLYSLILLTMACVLTLHAQTTIDVSSLNSGQNTISAGGDYVLTGTSTDTGTAYIKVTASDAVNITIKDFNVTRATDKVYNHFLQLSGTGKVTITLEGENSYTDTGTTSSSYGFLLVGDESNKTVATAEFSSASTGSLTLTTSAGSRRVIYNYYSTLTLAGGTLNIVATGSSSSAIYNYAYTDLPSTVNITGGVLNITVSGSTGRGIYNTSSGAEATLNITGGEVNITASGSTSACIYNYTSKEDYNTCCVVSITGGTLDLEQTHSSSDSAYGIYSVGQLTIADDAVVNVTTSGGTYNFGVFINGKGATLSVSGGTLNITTSKNYSYGLYINAVSDTKDNTVSITGGEVNITTSGTSAYGVYSQGYAGTNAISLTGGTLNVTTSGKNAYGIYNYSYKEASSSEITIDGATLNITTSGATAYGIYNYSYLTGSSSVITIDSGDVSVQTSGVIAIYNNTTSDGTITVDINTPIAVNTNGAAMTSGISDTSSTDNVKYILTLTDGVACAISSAVENASASYSRTFATQYSTLAIPFSCDVPEGVTAYALTDMGSNYLPFSVANTIEANVGYLVKVDEESIGSSFTFSASNTTICATTDLPSSGLIPVYTETVLAEADNIYKLAIENGKYVFNHSAGSATVAPFRAYLNTGDSEVKGALSLVFPEESTGIESVTTASNNECYTLQGVRVSNPTQRGIYIINGKKILK